MSEQRSMECIRAIRQFQLDYGNRISTTASIIIGNHITECFEKDPKGSQVIHYLNDLRERIG